VDSFSEREGGKLWDRFTVHYTPKHGSWLNQAEIELSLYSRQCLGKRRIPDLGTLKRETRIWNRQTDRKRTRINWQFTRKKARKLFHYAKLMGDNYEPIRTTTTPTAPVGRVRPVNKMARKGTSSTWGFAPSPRICRDPAIPG
jgi:hypothetical protein